MRHSMTTWLVFIMHIWFLVKGKVGLDYSRDDPAGDQPFIGNIHLIPLEIYRGDTTAAIL